MKLLSIFKAHVALLAVLVIIGGTTARAQSPTAQINGTVHDASSAVIPGATLTATQVSTGISSTASTSSNGLFSLPSLPPGQYTLTVRSDGFAPYTQTAIVLTVGQQLSLDIGLKVGTSTEAVEVSAAAVAVDSTSPTQQSTIDQKTVEQLPLNGRNPAALLYTVPGVNDAGLNIASAGAESTVKENDASNPQQSAPSVHGSRPGGTYFSLDGASNTDPYTVIGGPFPNPDATGEFSVVTGTYGSRYISAPGGAVNIITRSGGKAFHGSVFEFFRNGYFNARNALSDTPDILKRNQFGAAIGGPVKGDRLFFFASYQGTITRNNATSVDFVPTAAQRTGNFGTFQIPSYMISPAIQKYLKQIPLGDPNTGRLSVQTAANNTDQQGVLKLDYDFKNNRLFARAFYDRYQLGVAQPTAAGGALSEMQGYTQPWSSFAIGDTWSAGRWIFESRASYVRQLATEAVATNTTSYSSLGISGMSGYGPNPGYSTFLVSSGFYQSSGALTFFPRKAIELSEDVIGSLGRHQLSLGANYRHIRLDQAQYANPVAAFVGVNSYIDGLYGIIPGATFNPMADLILGAPYAYIQHDGLFASVAGHLLGLYAEDSYRLTNKLTLTAGMRWDPYIPYEVPGQKVTCFAPNQQSKVFINAPAGQIFPGDPNCPSNGIQSSYLQFQPRVGLAYQMDQGKTALRAGYGRYDLQAPLQAYSQFASAPWVRSYFLEQPFLSIDNLWASAGTTDPFAGGFLGPNYAPPANVAFTPGLNLSQFGRNSHPAYIQQWSLSLQHLFTTSDSIEIAYNGTAGVHLTIAESLNTPVNGPGASSTNEAARKPYQQFGIISSLESAATSSYNGLDATYTHRGKNLTVNSVFTWSHAIDDASSPGFGSGVSIPNTNHSFRRGRSDYDQNLVSRTTATWTLPSLAQSNRLIRGAFGSWSASGLVILDAGQPFSVSAGGDLSYTGLGLDLADRVPNQPVYKNGQLNLAAFTTNAAGTFGNSGRNAYRGPAFLNMDVGLMKSFPIERRLSGTFRAEAFNLLNHPNFFPPNSAYSTAAQSTFGVYQTARDPRIMQFSMKLSF